MGLFTWDRVADRKVAQSDAVAPRDPNTGILRGAEPGDFGPEHARGAVLFVHGFGGNGNRFWELPQRVARAGWRARVLLLPGHGTTPADLEQATAEQMLNAVADEARRLLQRHEKVVLLGHSMGGALATIIAAQEPQMAGLILCAPYYAITPRWYYGVRPEIWMRLGPSLARWVYSSPDRQPVFRREARRQIIALEWLPTKAAVTAMGIAARAADTAILEQIELPVLLLHGRRDEVTWPEAACRAVEKMATGTKRTVLLDNSNHILFWDHEREAVAREVLDFLQERL